MLGDDAVYGGLVGLRRGGAERQRDVGQAQLEQAIASAGLALVVALGHRPREDLDLARIEPEALIYRRDLRFDRALVRQ